MSSLEKINTLKSEEEEINDIYSKYRDEIMRISNNLKIEEFKEKLQKLRENENIVSRIKSINECSKSNINVLNISSEISKDNKTTVEYFNLCLEVIYSFKIKLVFGGKIR